MIRPLFCTVTILATAMLCHAAEPDRTDLFESGELGYGRYRIPALIVSKKEILRNVNL